MVNTSLVVAAVAALPAIISAATIPTGAWPVSQGSVKFTAPYVVKAGTTFDGGMKTYDRSDITCQGETESGSSTAVFLLEPGATLKNAIIGPNQMEGVHCDKHDCTVENVWWDDVCEDAFSVKGGNATSVTRVLGGGAREADDKVVQHNGLGSVYIDGFYAKNFGKLYRSCGTCGTGKQRKVVVSNVYVVNPSVSVVTVNQNNNDVAKLSNIKVESTKSTVKICQRSIAVNSGEPTMVGDGNDGVVCIYDPSTVTINGVAGTAGSTSATATSATTATTKPTTTKPTTTKTTKPTTSATTTATPTTTARTTATRTTATTTTRPTATSATTATTPASSSGSIPTGAWPTSKGSVKFPAAYVIKAGTTFDGGMKTYDRSDITCKGQSEGDLYAAVFILEPGATLKNAIIGVDQSEGVHCDSHDCTLENVWWEDVCEDAFTIKGGTASSVSRLIGGGARNASDKVVQHNGAGTVIIDGFFADNVGKLYRSCGSCKTQVQRKVQVSNVYAIQPKVSLVAINVNYNDEARLSNIKIETKKKKFVVCKKTEAVTSGEPVEVSQGPDGKMCIYDPASVQVIVKSS